MNRLYVCTCIHMFINNIQIQNINYIYLQKNKQTNAQQANK